jgi:hypothetical protein
MAEYEMETTTITQQEKVKKPIIHRNTDAPAPVPILSQTNPVHITPSHLSKIHPNIIHPPTSWSS